MPRTGPVQAARYHRHASPVLAWRVTLLCICLASCPWLQPVHADSPAQQQARLEGLRTHISALRAEIDAKHREQGSVALRLRDTEQELARLARRLRGIDEELERYRRRLAELESQRSQQAENLRAQQAALAGQVRAAYVMGRQERLKILLNQQDPASMGRVMAYYDYLNRARLQKMALIRDLLRDTQTLELGIREQTASLDELRAQQVIEMTALQTAQAERQAVLAALSRELQDQGQRLERLRNDERDLDALIARIGAVLADIPAEHPKMAAFSGLRGSLPWPARGRLVHDFGSPRLGGLVWDGVMISALEGQEVRAVHNGRVAFADWLRGFGLLLIVDHGDGYMTLYGNNQALFKETGDWVEAEEMIALTGVSGGREQAGLYFGIRHQGRPLDPARWCRRATGRSVG